jgi:hypothetical protein
MDFAMAMHMLLLKDTKDVFPIKGLQAGKYFLMFIKHCGTVSLPSFSVPSKRQVMSNVNVQENIFEVLEDSP